MKLCNTYGTNRNYANAAQNEASLVLQAKMDEYDTFDDYLEMVAGGCLFCFGDHCLCQEYKKFSKQHHQTPENPPNVSCE